MNLTYNFIIFLYTVSIRIAALANGKARKWVEGRKGIFTQLKNNVKPGEKTAWFHCASLGEFEQARPVIEAFKKRNPTWKILLTFFSPSGYEVRKNYPFADHVFYLPADTAKNAKQFIQLVKPSLAVFTKYDFWFNYLQELKVNKVPVAVFSAVFRSNHYFFKGYGTWFLKILSGIDHFFVQDERSKRLLNKAGIPQATICGDTRVDRVMQNAAGAEYFPLLEKFKDQNKVTLIAGSTWKEDERLILELIRKRKSTMKYIIAPHEISKKRIEKLVSEIEFNTVLFSEATDGNVSNADVIIIDSVGVLAQLYRYGDVAFIGGGFGKGIHNILEPAAFGLPVIFGENYQKFNEAKEMVNLSMAFNIDKFRSLNNKLTDLFFEKGKVEPVRKRIFDYMNSKKGATEIVVQGLEKLISGTN